MATHSHNIKEFIVRAQARKGIVRPIPCGRCGRMLTDPASIARGYGEECASQVSSERELIVTWPLGARVRITGGLDAGRTGTIVRVMPKRPYPVRVSVDGHMYVAWYPVNRLELIGGEG
jgi:hypothetical protein